VSPPGPGEGSDEPPAAPLERRRVDRDGTKLQTPGPAVPGAALAGFGEWLRAQEYRPRLEPPRARDAYRDTSEEET
jgi:hypothetical protein